jgi:glycosyltransferase involved in cell wall biosynthesis
MTSGARRPIRVLELRSVWGTGGGPEKTILLGAIQSDPARIAVTVCYIRDERDPVFGIDRRAEAAKLDYVEVRERHSLDWRIWPALRRLVRERQIDIVHAHEYKTDLLALMLARAERIVPLATVHGWTGHNRRDQCYYFFDKRLLARFPRLIAVSGEIAAELVRTGTRPDRIVTVLNGIDHRAFRREAHRVAAAREALGVPAGAFVIGSVGRLEPQKRFDVLIDAVGRVRATAPQVHLVIAGDGSLRESLAVQIARRGLEGTCRLVGHLDDVSRLHHGIDLFVQSSRYEGTPNAVLEAMALETPVVATNAGGTSELVRHGEDGLIVPPNDADALALAIERSIADPAGGAARARAARRRVEGELSFDTRMRRVETIYEELGTARTIRSPVLEVA